MQFRQLWKKLGYFLFQHLVTLVQTNLAKINPLLKMKHFDCLV